MTSNAILKLNLIRYSVLPWFDFTSISHARDFSLADSAPRITFGKITEADGRCTMPVSIHAHHALADGLHVAQFVEKFQQSLDAPDSEPGLAPLRCKPIGASSPQFFR